MVVVMHASRRHPSAQLMLRDREGGEKEIARDVDSVNGLLVGVGQLAHRGTISAAHAEVTRRDPAKVHRDTAR